MSIEQRARELLRALCLLPIRAGQEAEIALIAAALASQSEASADAPPHGWRPISEAPRDGSYVLLYDADFPGSIPLVGRWKRSSWWGEATISGRSIVWEDATHWMPLPEPPGGDDEHR